MTSIQTAEALATAMKLGMRRVAASVSVVTAKSASGAVQAMTASSVTSVSDSPASLLVCVQKSAAICASLAEGCAFNINVLRTEHDSLSTTCATAAQGEARFAQGDWMRGDLPARLNDAEAVFECSVAAVHPFGTHHIVVGTIDNVHITTGAPRPLLYLDGRYGVTSELG